MILDIKTCYVGDSSVSRLYMGDALVWDSSHPDILLNYIANGPDDNTSVNVGFDTGVNFSSTQHIKVEVKAATYKTNGTNNILGAVRQNSWDGLAMYAFRNGEQTVSSRLHTTVITQSGDFSSNIPFVASTYWDTSDVNPNNANQYGGKLVVNGQTTSSSGYASVPSRSFSIIICGQNSMNSSDGTVYLNNNPSGIKTYYVKIWSGNNLIRFYIPVLHFINGQYVACFYDKVNDNYIYNSGTDDVVYSVRGDTVLDFIANGLTCSDTRKGINYQTDISIAAGLCYDLKFKSGGVNGDTDENYIFGTRSSGGNKYGLFAPLANNTRIRYNIGSVYIDTWSVNTVYTSSTYIDASNKCCAYLNGTSYTGSSETSTSDVYSGYYVSIFANVGNQYEGNTIYYFCVRNGNNVALRNYVPVLHNGVPVFYDLNTCTYINGTATTNNPGTPVYVIQ